MGPGTDMDAIAGGGLSTDSLSDRSTGILPGGAGKRTTSEYNVIEDNGFRSALLSPLSTFSIDTDTAGYTELKYDILHGNEIVPDQVKIEELINYFDIGLEGERIEGAPFVISTSYSSCPWNKDHELLRIGIKADDGQTGTRKNLVLVADVSGSMLYLNKLPLALSAYADLVEALGPDDTVSLMYYADGDGTVLEGVPCDHKEEIYDGLAGLVFRAGGGTNGSLGLEKAYEMAKESFVEGGVNRILLATDGDFNIGRTSSGEMKEIVEMGRDDGIYLTILGYGEDNLKDNKMETMSKYGNGNYHFIGDLEDARKALVDEAASTLVPVADDVKIQVEFNPSIVQEYRLIGYEDRILEAEDFQDDDVDAGEIGAGKSVIALYEIVPVGAEAQTSVPGLKYSTDTRADQDEGPAKNTENTETVETETEIEADIGTDTDIDGVTGPIRDVCTVAVRYKDPGTSSGSITRTSGMESRLAERSVSTSEYVEVPDEATALAVSLAELGMLLRDSRYKGTSSISSVEILAEAVADQTDDPGIEQYADLITRLKEQSR